MAAVLLAAGGGRRFEGESHKLLTPFRGRPLVAWALDAVVDAELDETIVVTGAVDLRDLVGDRAVTVLDNPRWAEGMATSLQCGVIHAADAGHDAVVVGLADQPMVAAASWRAVAAAVGDEHPIAVATYGGRRGNPVALHRTIWPRLPTEGDEGARRLIAGEPGLVVEVACEGSAADVDTEEDLRRWS